MPTVRKSFSAEPASVLAACSDHKPARIHKWLNSFIRISWLNKMEYITDDTQTRTLAHAHTHTHTHSHTHTQQRVEAIQNTLCSDKD